MELRNLQILTEKSTKLSVMNDSRIQKEISSLRKSLLQERTLKLDAFRLVDELQSQVYDLEAQENMTVRSQNTQTSYKSSAFIYRTEASMKYVIIRTALKILDEVVRTNVISQASSKNSSFPFPRLFYEKKQPTQNGMRPKTVNLVFYNEVSEINFENYWDENKLWDKTKWKHLTFKSVLSSKSLQRFDLISKHVIWSWSLTKLIAKAKKFINVYFWIK